MMNDDLYEKESLLLAMYRSGYFSWLFNFYVAYFIGYSVGIGA